MQFVLARLQGDLRLLQAKVRDGEGGEVAEPAPPRIIQRPRLRVDEAEGAEPQAVLQAEGRAGVEPDAGRAGDERVAREARVQAGILDHEDVV